MWSRWWRNEMYRCMSLESFKKMLCVFKDLCLLSSTSRRPARKYYRSNTNKCAAKFGPRLSIPTARDPRLSLLQFLVCSGTEVGYVWYVTVTAMLLWQRQRCFICPLFSCSLYCVLCMSYDAISFIWNLSLLFLFLLEVSL